MKGAKITEEKKDTNISRLKPLENKPAENISKGGMMITKPKAETNTNTLNTNTVNNNTSTNTTTPTSTINRGANVIKKADDKKDSKEDPKKTGTSGTITKGGDNWRKK